jgi:ABC-type antimicrobial peptide transport system permease subunit
LQPGALEPVLKEVPAEVDPNVTLISVRTMQEQVSLSFNQQRAVASLAGLFGIVALLLAAVGLYGVTAYSVAQRTNEIGVRMALGANSASVLRMVLRGASFRVLLGLVFGVPLAIGAGRLISAQLYGVSSWDPLALAVATGTLGICAFFAAVIPARRAASISPMDALRTD